MSKISVLSVLIPSILYSLDINAANEIKVATVNNWAACVCFPAILLLIPELIAIEV